MAAAIVCRGRVLVQRRARPAELAGRWELPGGAVEVAESDHVALVRECGEELGVLVVPGGRVGPDIDLPGGRVLRVYAATIPGLPGDGDSGGNRWLPRAVEHAELRWVPAAQLDELDWLEADRVLLPDLHELLAGAIRWSGPGESPA